MGRSPCCSKEGLNRGAWTSDEDKVLTEYIRNHGQGRWRELPKKAGLKRCGKSCRLRWLNYLRPDIKRGNITPDEEELIIKLHKLLGNRWSLIAGRLPGRTDNEIKNYWNTTLGKRVDGSSTSTSMHKNSIQSKKKRHTSDLSNEAAGTSPHIQSVEAIRTKAHRCTKMFLTPQSASDPTKSQNTLVQQVDMKSCNNELHPCSQGEEDYKPSFMVDINMGNFDLSDLLGSDFSQLSYYHKEHRFDGDSKNSSSNDLSLCSDQTMLFNGGMLDDWRRSDCIQHSECSSDLHSLASFLDPDEGWLGE